LPFHAISSNIRFAFDIVFFCPLAKQSFAVVQSFDILKQSFALLFNGIRIFCIGRFATPFSAKENENGDISE
jgi:hypothetical protein